MDLNRKVVKPNLLILSRDWTTWLDHEELPHLCWHTARVKHRLCLNSMIQVVKHRGNPSNDGNFKVDSGLESPLPVPPEALLTPKIKEAYSIVATVGASLKVGYTLNVWSGYEKA